LKTNKAQQGGLADGKDHATGGIKGYIVSDYGEKKPIEIEHNEGVVNQNTMVSGKQYEFEGQIKTPCEIVSELNVNGMMSNDPNFKGAYIDCNSINGNEKDLVAYKTERNIASRGKIVTKVKEGDIPVQYKNIPKHYKNETFELAGHNFNITKAYSLLESGKIKAKIIEYSPKDLDSKITFIDEAKVNGIVNDYSRPLGLVVRIQGLKDAVMLIDGNHRTAKAVKDGKTKVSYIYVSDPSLFYSTKNETKWYAEGGATTQNNNKKTLYHISNELFNKFDTGEIEEVGYHFFEDKEAVFNVMNKGFVYKVEVDLGNLVNVPFDMNVWKVNKINERLEEIGKETLDFDNVDSIKYLNRKEYKWDSKTQKAIHYDSYIILNPDNIKIKETVFEGKELSQGGAITDSDNFKKWFGGSKVVDDSGNPLVVYHGTDAEFSKFNISKRGKYGKGIYLSIHEGDARIFGGKIMPLYASIKKPFIIPESELNNNEDAKYLGRRLIREGKYDGIIGGSIIIAFDSKQLKSATGNNGNFDKDSADITMESGGCACNDTVYADKGTNIKESFLLRKSDENLIVAKDLWNKGIYHRAISTYYYSMLQLMKSRLINECGYKSESFNSIPSSHVYIISNFGKKFSFSDKQIKGVKAIKKMRVLADYGTQYEAKDDILLNQMSKLHNLITIAKKRG